MDIIYGHYLWTLFMDIKTWDKIASVGLTLDQANAGANTGGRLPSFIHIIFEVYNMTLTVALLWC